MIGIERVLITCMDTRLSEEAEKNYNDGKTIFARNAGGLPGGLKNTVKRILEENSGIKEVLIMPHTDCGAMGAVFRCLMQGEKFDQEILDGLVKYFENKPILTREDLESTENVNECMREMVKIKNGVSKYKKKSIKISVELIELQTPHYIVGEEKNVLVIMPASTVKYSETFGKFLDIHHSYCIQGEIADVIKDIKLATAHNGLNLKEIYIPRLKKSDDAKVENIINELKIRLGFGIYNMAIFKLLEDGTKERVELKKKIKM